MLARGGGIEIADIQKMRGITAEPRLMGMLMIGLVRQHQKFVQQTAAAHAFAQAALLGGHHEGQLFMQQLRVIGVAGAA